MMESEAAHHGLSLVTPLDFLGAAVLAVPLFRLFKLGAVIGYLAVGVAVGPYGRRHLSTTRDLDRQCGELNPVIVKSLLDASQRPATGQDEVGPGRWRPWPADGGRASLVIRSPLTFPWVSCSC